MVEAGPYSSKSGLAKGHSGAVKVLAASGSGPVPRGAPASTQCTSVLICVADKLRSPRKWPTLGSARHGGIRCVRIISRIMGAKGAISSNFVKGIGDRKSTRLNSSHQIISYAVFCLKKKNADSRDRSQRMAYQQLAVPSGW